MTEVWGAECVACLLLAWYRGPLGGLHVARIALDAAEEAFRWGQNGRLHGGGVALHGGELLLHRPSFLMTPAMISAETETRRTKLRVLKVVLQPTTPLARRASG